MAKPPSLINAVLIDPAARTVTGRAVENSVEQWQFLVGGHFECVATVGEKHQIYAHEDGLHRPPFHWWSIGDGQHAPIERLAVTGPAFVVRVVGSPHGARFTSVREPLEDTVAAIQRWVVFLDKEEARERYAMMQAWRREQDDARIERMRQKLGDKAPHVVRMRPTPFPE